MLSAAAAPAASSNGDLLRRASQLSQLPVRRVVPQKMLGGARYDAALLRAAYQEYPRSLRSVDAALYERLGLTPRSLKAQLTSDTLASRAWYDPAAREGSALRSQDDCGRTVGTSSSPIAILQRSVAR